MTCSSRVRVPREASSTSGKGIEKWLFSVVIVLVQLAVSTDFSKKSFTFNSVVFLLQLVLCHIELFFIWDSNFQYCYRSYSSEILAGGLSSSKLC